MPVNTRKKINIYLECEKVIKLNASALPSLCRKESLSGGLYRYMDYLNLKQLKDRKRKRQVKLWHLLLYLSHIKIKEKLEGTRSL